MLKIGTVILCPLCLKEQLKSTKELLGGQQLKEAAWESLGFDMENAIRMGCYSCATLWYRKHPKTGATQIHTKDEGWVALTPKKPTEPTKSLIIQGPGTLH